MLKIFLKKLLCKTGLHYFPSVKAKVELVGGEYEADYVCPYCHKVWLNIGEARERAIKKAQKEKARRKAEDEKIAPALAHYREVIRDRNDYKKY